MASWVRKLIGVTAIAMVAGTFVFAGLAGAVEPGEGAPPDPGCTFAVTINEDGGVVPDGADTTNITVTGAIGGDFAGAEVSLVLNGTVGDPVPVADDGSFQFGPLDVDLPVDVSVSYTYGNQNAYTNVCIGPGGQSVVHIDPGGEVVTRPVAGPTAGPATRALALTGSDNTTRNVLIGIAAVVLGTMLVVGTRRRRRVKV